MAHPIINPDAGLSPVENGTIAYDSVADRLHELTPLGVLLAELCDGSRSVEEIRALGAPLILAGQIGEHEVPTDPPECGTDQISRWIDAGLEAGLLCWGDGATQPYRSLSAAELSDLAEHLRDGGKTGTAFLCAKRVTELTLEDSDAWFALGLAAQDDGRRGEARAAFEKYLELQPEDAVIRHMLTALRDEAPPPRAPDACILQSFRDFSTRYDDKMRNSLGYQAPERLQDLIRSALGDAMGLEILDIGCGTGLSGLALKARSARLVGIDLSPEMIRLAEERGIYDQLEVAEITAWLKESQAQFDVIAACDSLVYFGDLRLVAGAAARRLKPGGCFAFTMERGEKYPFHLTDSGRYTHHPDHVREVAADSGLLVDSLEEGCLRMERGLEVTGLLTLLRKSGAGRAAP